MITKIVKIPMTQEEFIKEVQETYPNKFTRDGLKVLFEHIEYLENSEYSIENIEEDYKEWSFKEAAINLGVHIVFHEKYLNDLLWELIHEDEYKDMIAGVTESTVVLTKYW